MSREKTERLLNLTLALLGTRTYLTKSQILSTVAGYDGPSESADRMFERDKDDLRELGIPIEVKTVDPLFDDEPGYRIDRRTYQLPPLQFTAQEMGWLNLAAHAWQRAALAGPAAEGLRKLIAVGAEPEEVPIDVGQLATQEGAFPALWDAVRDRCTVAFEYRKAGASASHERNVDPWGLLSTGGRWYLVGRDRDVDEVRVFRLSRITGKVRSQSRAGAFAVPEGIDLWSHVALLEAPVQHRYEAKVLAREGRAHALRRRALAIDAGPEGWDQLTLAVADTAVTAREIAALGESVIVTDPPELREAVVGLLRGVEARHG